MPRALQMQPSALRLGQGSVLWACFPVSWRWICAARLARPWNAPRTWPIWQPISSLEPARCTTAIGALDSAYGISPGRVLKTRFSAGSRVAYLYELCRCTASLCVALRAGEGWRQHRCFGGSAGMQASPGPARRLVLGRGVPVWAWRAVVAAQQARRLRARVGVAAPPAMPGCVWR